MKNNKILIFTSLLALSACTPTVAQRGNMLENHQLEQVVPGVHTRSDVLRLLGSPTTQSPFNDDIWYYIGQEKEKRGILDPEVVKERKIVVTFDQEGVVDAVNEVSSENIAVPIERSKTATHGNDMTFMQQLLGNLGRFNPQTEKK